MNKRQAIKAYVDWAVQQPEFRSKFEAEARKKTIDYLNYGIPLANGMLVH